MQAQVRSVTLVAADVRRDLAGTAEVFVFARHGGNADTDFRIAVENTQPISVDHGFVLHANRAERAFVGSKADLQQRRWHRLGNADANQTEFRQVATWLQ